MFNSLSDSLEFENVLVSLLLDEDVAFDKVKPELELTEHDVAELIGDAFEFSSICSNNGIFTVLSWWCKRVWRVVADLLLLRRLFKVLSVSFNFSISIIKSLLSFKT